MTTHPTWYTPVAWVALIWNLLGCAAYLADVMLTPEDVARMTPDQQMLYASRTSWAVAATAIAVWFGAAGSLGLILRQRWALPLLVASLFGLLVQDFGLFFLTNVSADVAVFVIQGLVLLIAIGLVQLARTAIARGWMTPTTA